MMEPQPTPFCRRPVQGDPRCRGCNPCPGADTLCPGTKCRDGRHMGSSFIGPPHNLSILTWIIFNFIGSFGSIHWSSSNASSSISSSSKHASPSLSVSSSLTSSPKWRGQRMSRVIYTRENVLSLATPSLMYIYICWTNND